MGNLTVVALFIICTTQAGVAYFAYESSLHQAAASEHRRQTDKLVMSSAQECTGAVLAMAKALTNSLTPR